MSVENARQYRRVRKSIPPNRRRRVWGAMTYRCRGNEDPRAAAEQRYQLQSAGNKEEAAKALEAGGCGFEHLVYLGVGCEGPPELKRAGETIPVPMYAGVCPECGGAMMHVRWQEDQQFAEKVPPVGAPVFLVPGKGTAARFAEQGFAGAELVRTAGEEAAIKRFHGPQPPER